ncbi:MAG TPA: porphobilinogen synthase [Proteobacteria bacterium]|nr:porphobilinogen synthase [Pseudomonadota bacterium]
MYFPVYRPRRLRADANIRRMIRETSLSVDDFIAPLFVCPGEGVRRPISSMPGNFQLSPDELVLEARRLKGLGIPAVILFGIPEHKDEAGSEAYDDGGIIQQAVRALKAEVRDLLVITDVCLCEYTSHGHCGIVVEGEVDNDQTLKLLAREALSHARAGADMVAPSDMMDGRVGCIRQALDEAGFARVSLMAYAVKYASAFYGPFRDAAQSPPQFGDRKGYQMDPANAREALREAALDIAEGADIIMVKPALPYLDILHSLRREFNYPLAAYNVSGEFAMIKAAAEKGWIDGELAMLESLMAIKRAGADMILTYFSAEAAALL